MRSTQKKIIKQSAETDNEVVEEGYLHCRIREESSKDLIFFVLRPWPDKTRPMKIWGKSVSSKIKSCTVKPLLKHLNNFQEPKDGTGPYVLLDWIWEVKTRIGQIFKDVVRCLAFILSKIENPCKILRKGVKLSGWKDWTKMDCEGSKMTSKKF